MRIYGDNWFVNMGDLKGDFRVFDARVYLDFYKRGEYVPPRYLLDPHSVSDIDSYPHGEDIKYYEREGIFLMLQDNEKYDKVLEKIEIYDLDVYPFVCVDNVNDLEKISDSVEFCHEHNYGLRISDYCGSVEFDEENYISKIAETEKTINVLSIDLPRPWERKSFANFAQQLKKHEPKIKSIIIDPAWYQTENIGQSYTDITYWKGMGRELKKNEKIAIQTIKNLNVSTNIEDDGSDYFAFDKQLIEKYNMYFGISGDCKLMYLVNTLAFLHLHSIGYDIFNRLVFGSSMVLFDNGIDIDASDSYLVGSKNIANGVDNFFEEKEKNKILVENAKKIAKNLAKI